MHFDVVELKLDFSWFEYWIYQIAAYNNKLNKQILVYLRITNVDSFKNKIFSPKNILHLGIYFAVNYKTDEIFSINL